MNINLDPVSQDSSAVLRGSSPVVASTDYNLLYVLGVAFVASAGGFLFGYDLALIAGALPFLTRDFGLSAAMSGWTAASAVIGAIIGPLLPPRPGCRLLRACMVRSAFSSTKASFIFRTSKRP